MVVWPIILVHYDISEATDLQEMLGGGNEPQAAVNPGIMRGREILTSNVSKHLVD